MSGVTEGLRLDRRALLAVGLLLPLVVAAAWGQVTNDAAYVPMNAARDLVAGAGWRGDLSLHTLLLALAAWLRLPLPPTALALSALGWAAGVVAWTAVGLALRRPTFALAAMLLLVTHPLQGQALGLEAALALGLAGLTAWWTARRCLGAALAALLLLALTRPLAVALVLPLLLRAWLRPHARPTLSSLAAGPLLAGGIEGLLGLLQGADASRLALMLAALELTVAAGFAAAVPDLEWLAVPFERREALRRVVLLIALVALIVWQGSALWQDWRLRPVERLRLYEEIALWLRENSLPTETIATERPAMLACLTGRQTLPQEQPCESPFLPQSTQRSQRVWVPGGDLGGETRERACISTGEQNQADYLIVPRSAAWQSMLARPSFVERWREVYRAASPYDAATPLLVLRYQPSPFDAGETVSSTAVFDGRIALLARRMGNRRIVPGEPLYLTLTWRAATPVDEPLRRVVRLVDAASGQVWAQTESVTPGGLSTALWNVGAPLEDRQMLLAPADLPPGTYRLEAALYRPNGAALPTQDGAEGATLASLDCPPAVSTALPTPDHPLSFTFGSEIALLGYDAPTRVAPGERLRLAFYWRVLAPVPLGYKVFVHLLGPDGEIVAQADSVPVGWTYPTTAWQPGETVRDEHVLELPATAARGDYLLAVGLYDPVSGDRVVARDAAGAVLAERRVLLGPLEVR